LRPYFQYENRSASISKAWNLFKIFGHLVQ